MSKHGDGGKGSGRRQEDVKKIHDNWDLIFGKKDKAMEEYDDDGEVICSNCGADMSPTEHGRWLHCDVCGNTEDFVEDDYYE